MSSVSKGLDALALSRKHLESLEQMVNIQEVLMLVRVALELLVNAVNFLHTLAEIVSLLVHLKLFSYNFVLMGSVPPRCRWHVSQRPLVRCRRFQIILWKH